MKDTGMTVDEALQFAGDATKGATFYDCMRGPLMTMAVLAAEVRRLRAYVEPINQCDGCQAKMHTVDGMHYHNDKPVMVCTKSLYVGKRVPPEIIERVEELQIDPVINMTNDQIKQILVAHGFKLHDGDLKPYVYEAIEAVLAVYEQLQSTISIVDDNDIKGRLAAAGMADLPVCRLCKCAPYEFIEGNVECAHPDCIRGEFTKEQWQKLMYVPDKLSWFPLNYENDGYMEGDNAAIDDIEKGGE